MTYWSRTFILFSKRKEEKMPEPADANQSRLSLQHFRGIIRRYLVALAEADVLLKERYASLFNTEELAIQPLDCRETSDTLKETHSLVQECNSLLLEDKLLPIGALAPRYKLLFASQLVQEQTRRLIDLFDSYLFQCLQPSLQAERTRKKIQKLFQEVLEYISEIPGQVRYLEKESQLMEEELLATLNE
jgi:hypothetical protein